MWHAPPWMLRLVVLLTVDFAGCGQAPRGASAPSAPRASSIMPGDDIARPVDNFPDFRAYWLGARFAGAGDLPPLAPGRVERPLEPGGGPGYQFILSYGRADHPFGLPLVTM